MVHTAAEYEAESLKWITASDQTLSDTRMCILRAQVNATLAQAAAIEAQSQQISDAVVNTMFRIHHGN